MTTAKRKPVSVHLAEIPVASLIVLIIAVTGALVTVIHPETLDFATYIKYVGPAAGLLGIGRGLDAVHRP